MNLIRHFIQYVYNKTLRPYLPRKLGYMNRYVVRSPRLFDQTDVREDTQLFEVTAHEEYTREGDTVVVVGGGNGVSSIAAAEKVGFDGEVLVYEASSDLVPALRESMDLNQVADRVEVIQAIVGQPGSSIWGPSGDSPVVSASELPKMDVLELDCEGAELKILRNLSNYPRVLTVEAHPQFGVPVEDIRNWLTRENYEVARESKTGNVHHFTGLRKEVES